MHFSIAMSAMTTTMDEHLNGHVWFTERLLRNFQYPLRMSALKKARNLHINTHVKTDDGGVLMWEKWNGNESGER